MKKIVLSDDKLFMYCCVFAVIVFTCAASFMCVTLLDQVLMVCIAVSLLVLPYVFKAWKKRNS